VEDSAVAEHQVNLPDSVSEFAGAQVAAGRFASVDAYLGALVSADEQFLRSVAALDEHPRLAELLEDSLTHGAGRRWSPAVLDELKQQLLGRSRESRP
jgi:Arc/MetJ-type ribon-helix-helix transcriptional regulator